MNHSDTKELANDPISIRLGEEEEAIEQLHKDTGIPKADLVRRAVRYAIPRFNEDRLLMLEMGKKS